MLKRQKHRTHRRKHDIAHRAKKQEEKDRDTFEAAFGDIGDTAEKLDESTLSEIMELLQRVEENDLPPKPIMLIHHVQRPRFVPDQTADPQPGAAIVLLRYTPPNPGDTARAEAEDAEAAKTEEGETEWNVNGHPTSSTRSTK